MYFGTKSYLKSNRNHTTKHALSYKLMLNQEMWWSNERELQKLLGFV
jgi:hypothetical protein